MNWDEARVRTLDTWRRIRNAIGEADDVELLTEINAVCDLCEKADEEAAGRWGRCDFCLAFQQFGGCQGIGLRMSECVVHRDWDGLRALADRYIAQLETLDAPAGD